MLVLSLFPGIDVLGMGFELEGFCVVRGPDPIFGGDIRKFSPPKGKFDGIIGGPPCQDFSAARRSEPTGYGLEMLQEFARVVQACRPQWWLMENVPSVPDVRVFGGTASWQRFDIDQGWFSGIRRLRHIQFEDRYGRQLDPPKGKPIEGAEPPALACDERPLSELIRLQGLPEGFELPGMTVEGAKRAIGNAVPLVMARELARLVRRAHGLPINGRPPVFDPLAIARRRCACGCGRELKGRQRYASATCRKRAQLKRDRARGETVRARGVPS